MHRPLDRRHFLRYAGIAVALPSLESMQRAIAAPAAKATAAAQVRPYRMIAIGTPFGFDPTAFVPTTTGVDYALSPHLEHLAAYRNDFTVISGLCHPNTGGGGHKAEAVMLTGAPYPDYSYNLKNTISLDQEFSSRFRGQTRYDGLVLTTSGGTLSYTSNGVAIPSLSRPSEIFSKLFLSGTPQQAANELRRIREGRSMLDFVGEQAQRLSRRVTPADRARLDEYFTSVRSVEKQLEMSAEWVHRPKPQPIGSPPKDITVAGEQPQKLQLMFDMIHLALVTDSTRSITIKTFGDHHDLSHHGREPNKLEQCRGVELDLIKTYGSLLGKLKSSQEGDGASLLDSSMVLMTSNLRDGNTHWTSNLPVLLAGGGFKHGRHLTYNQGYVESIREYHEDPTTRKSAPALATSPVPLCNLYLSMLQRAGIETDAFGSSSGTLTGLESV